MEFALSFPVVHPFTLTHLITVNNTWRICLYYLLLSRLLVLHTVLSHIQYFCSVFSVGLFHSASPEIINTVLVHACVFILNRKNTIHFNFMHNRLICAYLLITDFMYIRQTRSYFFHSLLRNIFSAFHSKKFFRSRWQKISCLRV